MKPAKQNYKRRNIIPRPELQWPWALRDGFMMLFGYLAGLVGMVVLPYLLIPIIPNLERSHLLLMDSIRNHGHYIILIGLALFSLTVYMQIRFSFRVAGPLFRFEKVLNLRLEGKKTHPINLRQKDMLLGLAALLNDYFEKEDSIRSASKRVLKAADKITSPTKNASPTHRKKNLESLRSESETLRKEISSWKS